MKAARDAMEHAASAIDSAILSMSFVPRPPKAPKEQATSYSRMAVHTVTARYELEFKFDVPEDIDLYDPSVDQWCVSYFDDDWIHIPTLCVYYKDGREVVIKGCLDSDGEAVEIVEQN